MRGIVVGQWKVPDGIKITADDNIAFPREVLELWFTKQRITLSFRVFGI